MIKKFIFFIIAICYSQIVFAGYDDEYTYEIRFYCEGSYYDDYRIEGESGAWVSIPSISRVCPGSEEGSEWDCVRDYEIEIQITPNHPGCRQWWPGGKPSERKYTLTRVCGSVTVNGTTKSASGTIDNKTGIKNGDTYNLRDSDNKCLLPGYELTGWSCTNGLTSETKWTINNNSTCTAQWREIPKINLEFYEDADATTLVTTGQCIVDGKIGTLPEAPRKPGYRFTGWKVKNLCGIDKFTEEQKALNGFANYGYNWIVNNGSYCYYWDNGSYGTYSCSDTLDLETNGDWMAKFDYGTIYGEANCSP